MIFDAGYDPMRLAYQLADLPVQVLGRLRSDRVLHFPAPPARRDGKPGRPPRHGTELKLADERTWPAPHVTTVTATARYGTAVACSWDRLHPRLASRSAWLDHDGPLPVIEGTLIRLAVDHLPGDRDPRPIWLWSSATGAAADQVDRLWQAFLRRFDLEHTFRLVKQVLAALRSADLETAEQMAAEADGLLRRAGVPMGVAHNLEGHGIIAFERGELSEAASLLNEAIQAFASYGNIGCTAHALEAAAVVIATAAYDGDRLAAELLAAAEQFRQQSGQDHRPWEIRARPKPSKNRIATPTATADTTAHAVGRRYTLSVASMLAAQALQSLQIPTPADP